MQVAIPAIKSAASRRDLGIWGTDRVTLVFYFRDSRRYLADKATDVVAQIFSIIYSMNSFTKTAI